MDKAVYGIFLCLYILFPISKGCGTSDSPIVILLGNGEKLNITSPNYPDNYPNNITCYWFVRTAPDNKLKYRFVGEFQLESECSYDNVTLYDPVNTTNFIGIYCGRSRPNPGTTTGRYLFVSFKSDASSSFAGFNLEITSKKNDSIGEFTAAPNSSLPTMTNNASYTVPTNKSECGSYNSPITYTLDPDHTLNISSPNYPLHYPDNEMCYWLVRASQDNKLKYRFIDEFQLEPGCQHDNVTLYDSSNATNIIGTYCGSYRPYPGATTGRYLFVSFKSDGSSSHTGFKLEITSKEDECGTSDSPTKFVLGPTNQPIYISSPNFPDHYPKNKTCHWLLQTTPDRKLNFKFIGQFQLGTHRRCVHDNVKLYDSSNTSNIIGSYCGLSQYNTSTTTGKYLYVSFTSDGNETSTGFKLEIISTQNDGSRDSPIRYALERGLTLSITSPNYPDDYPENVKFDWLVETSPGSKLHYRFIGKFQLESGCRHDNVTLYDSSNATNVIGSYCGSSRPNPGVTTGRYLFVSFKSDGVSSHTGFKLEITSADYECGSSDSPPTFVVGYSQPIYISSPNFPDHYPKNETCHWLVRADPGSKLNFKFIGQFQLGTHRRCVRDNVRLYDSSNTSNIIGSYCGLSQYNTSTTTGRYLYVSFTSDGNETSTGFILEISSTQNDSKITYALEPGLTLSITSPKYADDYPDNVKFDWLVQTSPGSILQYRFDGLFHLEYHHQCLYDNVTLYDASNTTNVIGSYCGSSPPNPGITTGRYLYVSFKSDTSSTFPGFNLEITSTYNDFNGGLTGVTNSSWLNTTNGLSNNTTPTNASGTSLSCGAFDSPTTYVLRLGHRINITTPNYPRDYPNNENCYWLVRTTPDNKLGYRFIGQFQLENGCQYDNVKLHDSSHTSNVIGTYCGSSRPNPGITTGRYLFVSFKSDGSSSYAGFNIEITSRAHECGTLDSPTTYVLGGYRRTLNISSPNFPDIYLNNKTCHWLVKAVPDTNLNYRFIGQSQLGTHRRCAYDNVRLYDSSNTSNIIGSYCGLSQYDTSTTTGSYLFISYTSDDNATSTGFKLEISTKQDACGTSDSPTIYVLGPGHTVNITSPNYPYDYPNNKACHWLVQAAQDFIVKYRFIGQFQLESGCSYDNVTLYDSSNTTNVIGTYCSSTPPNPGTTTGRYLYVSFKSDGYSTSAGFNLEITSTKDECGTSNSPTTYVLGPGQSVTITSPNYPYDYPNNIICHWLVQTARDSTIKYRFIGSVEMQGGDQCQYDSVTLYDSSNTTNMIGSYCSHRPSSGTSTSRYLFVIFKSDGRAVQTGFNLEILSKDYACGTSDSPTKYLLGRGQTLNITSPHYPRNYPNEEECHWLVETTPGSILKYSFIGEFELESGGTKCRLDSVTLYDSSTTTKLIDTYCWYRPYPGITTDRYLFVSFKSGRGSTSAGFNLQVHSK